MRRPTILQRQARRLSTMRFHDTTIYIYGYVDTDGRVLYVGRTYDPGTRHGAHRQRSHWWSPDLTFSVIAEVVGWEAAKSREAQAIRDLAPVFNIVHNRRAA